VGRVRDEDHALVGTMFDPYLARVGNEELESWLLRLLEPKIDFRFFRVMVDGRSMVLLEIARATRVQYASRAKSSFASAAIRRG
jgi:ATP-dependent DNA helicase RecG